MAAAAAELPRHSQLLRRRCWTHSQPLADCPCLWVCQAPAAAPIAARPVIGWRMHCGAARHLMLLQLWQRRLLARAHAAAEGAVHWRSLLQQRGAACGQLHVVSGTPAAPVEADTGKDTVRVKLKHAQLRKPAPHQTTSLTCRSAVCMSCCMSATCSLSTVRCAEDATAELGCLPSASRAPSPAVQQQHCVVERLSRDKATANRVSMLTNDICRTHHCQLHLLPRCPGTWRVQAVSRGGQHCCCCSVGRAVGTGRARNNACCFGWRQRRLLHHVCRCCCSLDASDNLLARHSTTPHSTGSLSVFGAPGGHSLLRTLQTTDAPIPPR